MGSPADAAPPELVACEWRVEFENRSAETAVVPVIAATHGDAIRRARPELARRHGPGIQWWPIGACRKTPAADEHDR